MKIKDLIEILEEYNLEADVYATNSEEEYDFDYFHGSNGNTKKEASEVYIFIEKNKRIK